eukprot:g7081.t1
MRTFDRDVEAAVLRALREEEQRVAAESSPEEQLEAASRAIIDWQRDTYDTGDDDGKAGNEHVHAVTFPKLAPGILLHNQPLIRELSKLPRFLNALEALVSDGRIYIERAPKASDFSFFLGIPRERVAQQRILWAEQDAREEAERLQEDEDLGKSIVQFLVDVACSDVPADVVQRCAMFGGRTGPETKASDQQYSSASRKREADGRFRQAVQRLVDQGHVSRKANGKGRLKNMISLAAIPSGAARLRTSAAALVAKLCTSVLSAVPQGEALNCNDLVTNVEARLRALESAGKGPHPGAHEPLMLRVRVPLSAPTVGITLECARVLSKPANTSVHGVHAHSPAAAASPPFVPGDAMWRVQDTDVSAVGDGEQVADTMLSELRKLDAAGQPRCLDILVGRPAQSAAALEVAALLQDDAARATAHSTLEAAAMFDTSAGSTGTWVDVNDKRPSIGEFSGCELRPQDAADTTTGRVVGAAWEYNGDSERHEWRLELHWDGDPGSATHAWESDVRDAVEAQQPSPQQSTPLQRVLQQPSQQQPPRQQQQLAEERHEELARRFGWRDAEPGGSTQSAAAAVPVAAERTPAIGGSRSVGFTQDVESKQKRARPGDENGDEDDTAKRLRLSLCTTGGGAEKPGEGLPAAAAADD